MIWDAAFIAYLQFSPAVARIANPGAVGGGKPGGSVAAEAFGTAVLVPRERKSRIPAKIKTTKPSAATMPKVRAVWLKRWLLRTIIVWRTRVLGNLAFAFLVGGLRLGS